MKKDEFPPLLHPNPAQMVELISMFGMALVQSEIYEADAQYLIEHLEDVRTGITAFLQSYITVNQLIVCESLLAGEFNVEISLFELARKCQFHDQFLLHWSVLGDPRVKPAERYEVVTFRNAVWGSNMTERLRKYGYRTATLREVLTLLVAHPNLLQKYPSLPVFGSDVAGMMDKVPRIRLELPDTKHLVHMDRQFMFRPQSYHVIVSKLE